MRKHHKKMVAFVIRLLDKPKWYNETVTHPNWPMIKKSMERYEAIAVNNMPPALQENYEKMDELKSWYQSQAMFALSPPKFAIGATA